MHTDASCSKFSVEFTISALDLLISIVVENDKIGIKPMPTPLIAAPFVRTRLSAINIKSSRHDDRGLVLKQRWRQARRFRNRRYRTE